MITRGPVTVLVRDIMHGVGASIGANVRVRTLDNFIVGRLNAALQPPNPVGRLESGECIKRWDEGKV